MAHKILLKAGIKKHKGILIGIFILMLLVAISLTTVLTIWASSASYISQELSRAEYGTLTAWVSGVPSTEQLASELASQERVQRVEVQSLAFASYTINGQEADSEGQLLPYAPTDNRYRFFADNLVQYLHSTPNIKGNEVYISPSLISIFDVKIGDTITFAIARNGDSRDFIVKGFYEDPFMGSSMIGMKGFLISPQASADIYQTIKATGINALAREGAMLHIFSNKNTTAAQLNSDINQHTSIANYIEFIHSDDAISGFMLVLHNAFCSMLMAFVAVLLLVVLVALGHGISSNINADYVNMGILKGMGFTSKRLQQIQLMQYLACVLPSMLLGAILGVPASSLIARATLTTTGVLIPCDLPVGVCFVAFAVLLSILCGFIALKTAKIHRITPMHAIAGVEWNATTMQPSTIKISGEHLHLSLAIRQLMTGKKRYISACLVAVLLVFFASTIGRMDSWLGADGKGMMDAFNPADHHIGVQMFGKSTLENAKEITRNYTEITDSYMLAMVNASVNGIGYRANVITQPDRFHILSGRTSTADDEIVITELIAADQGVGIGDIVMVSGDKGSSEYTVSGIYSCANDMGGNIGMSREGYLRIAQDNPQIWCEHYFIEDISQKAAITTALTTSFGGDVHVHENTWPGLNGIILAMRALVVFMYVMVVLFVLVITTMTASKILSAEERDLGIYKAIGFTHIQLRLAFALRFGIIAAIGSVIGASLSTAITDILVGAVMRLAGISNFASSPSGFALAFPPIIVTLLFATFAYLASAKIKHTDLTVLITE